MKYGIAFFLILFSVQSAQSAEDLFDDYTKDILNDAKAKNINVHSALSDNITYRVKHRLSKGIVIENNEDNNYNGWGNVEIEKGANVGNVIVDTDMGKNNTVIFQNGDSKKKRY